MDDLTATDVPAIPGVRFRPFGGPADYRAILAIHEARRERDHVDPLSVEEAIPTAEAVAGRFERPYHFDPRRDAIFAEVGGDVVGHGRTNWWTEEDGTWLYLHAGYVAPAWRGRGIGTAMLRWLEARIRAISAGHPTRGKAMFGANASSTEVDAARLLQYEGYRPVKVLVEMGCDDLARAGQIHLPAGIAVRPPRPQEFRAVWEAVIRANHDPEPGPIELERRLEWYRRFRCQDGDLSRPNFDAGLLHVAWDGDHVVGMVQCAIGEGRGEVREVAVRRAWRRRGVAKSLLARGLHSLRERGVGVARLTTPGEVLVDGEWQRYQYRTTDLYGSVGFRPLKEFVRYRKPL